MVENIDAEREPVGDMLDAYKAWLKQRGPLGVGAMPERIFFAGWLAARRTPSASIGEHGLAEELAALRAEVLEWLCVSCNTVYPGAPKPGLFCVMCPQCGGTTGPRGIVERRVLERKVADLRAQLARQSQGAELAKHLRTAHAFIESTEAFGDVAASGILECGEVLWDIDKSKAALAGFAAPPLSSEQRAEKGQTNVG